MSSEFNKHLFLQFAAITIWAFFTGYLQVFSDFPAYDDEGYLMISVQNFLRGLTLYDQVYTQYGPGYYLYKYLIFTATGLPVTHDATRFTTLIMWILTAFLSGVLTFRLTRSAFGAALTYILTFLMLFRTTKEPGHPQELCAALLVAALLLATGKTAGRSFDLRLALIAAATATLFLTKVNLGIFLGIAVTIAVVALARKNRLQQIALFALVALAATMPFVLFKNHLAFGWLALAVSIAAALLAAWLTSLRAIEKNVFAPKHFAILTASFSATFAALCAFVFWRGTTAKAFADGVLLQHLSFGERFFQVAPTKFYTIFWALIAAATAAAIFAAHRKRAESTAKTVSLLKLVFGVAVVSLSILGYDYYLNSVALLNAATAFLWLALLNRNLRETNGNNDFARIMLVVAAALQPIQTYPIAGTQVNFAAFPMIVVGAVCLADALAETRILLPESFGRKQLQTAAVAALAIVVGSYAIYRTAAIRRIYSANVLLDFPGAARVRIAEQDRALYAFLVENLRRDCAGVASLPGIYSLNFWAQKETLTTVNVTAWIVLLDDEQQRRNVEILRQTPNLCAVYREQETKLGLRGKDVLQSPQARFLLENLREVGKLRDYRILKSAAQNRDLVYAAKFSIAEPNTIEFVLPANENRRIARFELYDWRQRKTFADNAQNRFSALEPLVDSSSVKRFKFKHALNFAALPPSDDLLLRLFDADNNLIASIPFPTN